MLAGEVFPDFSVALLHGKMPSEEKLRVLAEFQSGAVSLLVCTTVIEVGIDVPNATLMVIENAERFGLAQLHQLRGRVGRGDRPGRCVLLTGADVNEEALQRMRLMCETNDGFRIAEEDLKLRGPGELSGIRQSGLPEFRFVDLVEDREVMEWSRQEARRYFESTDTGNAERERIMDRARRLWTGRFDVLQSA